MITYCFNGEFLRLSRITADHLDNGELKPQIKSLTDEQQSRMENGNFLSPS